jgi:hypothetical protein
MYQSKKELAEERARLSRIMWREQADMRVAMAKALRAQEEYNKKPANANAWIRYWNDLQAGGNSVPRPQGDKPEFLR